MNFIQFFLCNINTICNAFEVGVNWYILLIAVSCILPLNPDKNLYRGWAKLLKYWFKLELYGFRLIIWFQTFGSKGGKDYKYIYGTMTHSRYLVIKTLKGYEG